MSEFEIVKSEYNALDEAGNYKTHYFRTSVDPIVGLSTVGSTGSYNDLIDKPIIVPAGTIISYAGNATPDGFLDCSGAELNPNTYARLFGVIGTTYGGNGSTTFNLPNLNNNSFLEGSTTVGTVKSAGLPNITGSISRFNGGSSASGSGAISLSYLAAAASEGSSNKYYSASFNASTSNSIYGASTTVQPKSVTVKFCIKY